VTTASGGPLKAGASNALILSSGTAGNPLDGVLIYGQDSTGTRQGSFTETGGMNIFVKFAGCGLNPQGQISGVIQQDIVSENVCYDYLFHFFALLFSPTVYGVRVAKRKYNRKPTQASPTTSRPVSQTTTSRSPVSPSQTPASASGLTRSR
jgi:hypothetical protein